MDPFLGIGHSAIAAQECSDLVKAFIGFDIDEEYLMVAREALKARYRQDVLDLVDETKGSSVS
jgi:hypothetical protein